MNFVIFFDYNFIRSTKKNSKNSRIYCNIFVLKWFFKCPVQLKEKYWFLTKNWFDYTHNLSHSPLYPDVLKIKTIIVVKQNKNICYYIQIHLWLLCARLGQMAFLFHSNYSFYFQNIWIQWWMWQIVSMVKPIFG